MKWLPALLALGCAQAAGADLEASYRFLVSDHQSAGGVLYSITTGPLAKLELPLSYVDDAEYWGAYVCALAGNSCAVTDTYSPSDYTLTPLPGPAGTLQTERLDVHNGTSIYDAATWQIAVVLGAVDNHYGTRSQHDAYALANAENRLLQLGFDGTAAVRATTTASAFQYNGHRITDPQSAYAFRMLSANWLAADPFMGTRYASLIGTSGLPADKPDYQAGKLTWRDWKPLTGENAWAFLLGPLQSAFLHYVRGAQQRFVPFHDLAVQDALAVLPTFAAMQSSRGGVYYAPAATSANQGSKPGSRYAVSVENNLSLYAGLQILQQTLRVELAYEQDLRRADRAAIQAALATISAMLDGGRAVPGTVTEGLRAFFRASAWIDGAFVQGGLADDPGAAHSWLPTLEPRAVDVNTWGIAALGTERLDQWFGFAAAFRSWQSLKQWGGYGVGATLWGVGYSDRDGNGLDPDGSYRQGVLSAEWTAGAINAVRNMIHHYQSLKPGSAHYAEAASMLQSLREDEVSMLEGVQALRVDRYAAVAFPGQPPHWSAGNSGAALPYLYASRRYFIPFGWYANPLPSTCATAWQIMLADQFDPLGYGGEPN